MIDRDRLTTLLHDLRVLVAQACQRSYEDAAECLEALLRLDE